MTSTVGSYPAPPLATARRLEWAFLPPNLRAWIERKCGSPVAEAISQTSGFTPGFASVLVCEDGTRHFVKAASVKAQRLFADSYREEARKLASLPRTVRAPRLAWHLDDDWVVLGIEHVPGRTPTRPWSPADLDATLDLLETVADELTPSHLELDTFAADCLPMLACWEHVRTHLARPHLDEAEALARGFPEVCGGETLVHTDVRADNVLVDEEGLAWLVDWNWPARRCPLARLADGPDRPARRRARRRGRDGRATAAARRTGRGGRRGHRAARRLLPPRRRPARAAHLSTPARAPAVAGRGLLAVAGGAPRLGVSPDRRGT